MSLHFSSFVILSFSCSFIGYYKHFWSSLFKTGSVEKASFQVQLLLPKQSNFSCLVGSHFICMTYVLMHMLPQCAKVRRVPIFRLCRLQGLVTLVKWLSKTIHLYVLDYIACNSVTLLAMFPMFPMFPNAYILNDYLQNWWGQCFFLSITIICCLRVSRDPLNSVSSMIDAGFTQLVLYFAAFDYITFLGSSFVMILQRSTAYYSCHQCTPAYTYDDPTLQDFQKVLLEPFLFDKWMSSYSTTL